MKIKALKTCFHTFPSAPRGVPAMTHLTMLLRIVFTSKKYKQNSKTAKKYFFKCLQPRLCSKYIVETALIYTQMLQKATEKDLSKHWTVIQSRSWLWCRDYLRSLTSSCSTRLFYNSITFISVHRDVHDILNILSCARSRQKAEDADEKTSGWASSEVSWTKMFKRSNLKPERTSQTKCF